MEVEGFNALVTFDKALPDQNSLRSAGLGVIVVSLHPINYAGLRKLAPDIERALEFLQPGQVMHVPEHKA